MKVADARLGLRVRWNSTDFSPEEVPPARIIGLWERFARSPEDLGLRQTTCTLLFDRGFPENPLSGQQITELRVLLETVELLDEETEAT